MSKQDKCRGCRNDFYNGKNGSLGVKQCWSLKDAKVVTRFRIGTWTTPTQKGAFTRVRVFDCYHQNGAAHYTQLPDSVNPKDVRKAGA